MTIITKAISDKKPKGLGVPLVAADGLNTVTVDINNLNDDGTTDRDGIYGFSYCTTMYLFFAAIIVMTFGFVGGLYLYDEYGRAQTHRFHGWCKIPYGGKVQGISAEQLQADTRTEVETFLSDFMKDTNNLDDFVSSFKEHFELGLDDESYEKIDVPDFSNGRQGRFVHDFSTNMTAILDPNGKRCFVMPLDRKAVLPPQSLLDMLNKMMTGYYDVDLAIVKQNMRVQLPPINDFSKIGPYIDRECSLYPTYRLEKIVHGVYKRSLDSADPMKFTQFAGKNVQEFDIVNIDDVLKYEEDLKKNL